MYLALSKFAPSQRKFQFCSFYWSTLGAKLTKLSPLGMTGKGTAEKAGPRKGEEKVKWPCPSSHSSVR